MRPTERISRRQFSRLGVASVAAGWATNGLTAFAPIASAAPDGGAAPVKISTGPHLFIDEFLIAENRSLSRIVHAPTRVDHPVLDSARFGTTQPYLTVLADDGHKSYRCWFNRGSAIWHAESSNGVAWSNPRLVWDIQQAFGCSVIDDGPTAPDPTRRFKLANWQSTAGRSNTADDNAGMFVGFSRDGLSWTAHPGNPVLRTWTDGPGKLTRNGVSDIIDTFRDPTGKGYVAAVKVFGLRGEGWEPAPRSGEYARRLVGMTRSADFIRWETPKRILMPDAKDDGLLEFYGMGAIHARGPLLIGMARVLRDDLPAEPGGPRDGIGYTVLVTSRDGVTWTRDREPFLDRNPTPGTWDRAMAWAGSVVLKDDELLVYYGGYARGHKIAPEKERQLGLARMRRDRYVSRTAAGAQQGVLRTRSLRLPAGQLTVNAAVRGAMSVRLMDAGSGQSFQDPDIGSVVGDSLSHRLPWRIPPGSPPVILEFQLSDADVFGFTVSA
jgi:hypothetical protein